MNKDLENPGYDAEKPHTPQERVEAVAQLEADLQSGFWFRIEPGMEISYPYSEKPEKVGEHTFGDLKGSEETYCSNNGIIVVVSKSGRYYATPWTEERARLVERAYRREQLHVPFSNGDIPTEPRLKERWKDLCLVARAEEIKKRIISEHKDSV